MLLSLLLGIYYLYRTSSSPKSLNYVYSSSKSPKRPKTTMQKLNTMRSVSGYHNLFYTKERKISILAKEKEDIPHENFKTFQKVNEEGKKEKKVIEKIAYQKKENPVIVIDHSKPKNNVEKHFTIEDKEISGIKEEDDNIDILKEIHDEFYEKNDDNIYNDFEMEAKGSDKNLGIINEESHEKSTLKKNEKDSKEHLKPDTSYKIENEKDISRIVKNEKSGQSQLFKDEEINEEEVLEKPSEKSFVNDDKIEEEMIEGSMNLKSQNLRIRKIYMLI